MEYAAHRLSIKSFERLRGHVCVDTRPGVGTAVDYMLDNVIPRSDFQIHDVA
jgi:hypothetical protein